MAKKSQKTSDCSDDLEWESHLVIRFPPEIAPKVESFIEEDARANDRLSIKFCDDLRSGILRFDQRNLSFKLFDLPTITEVTKTLDNKNIFKVTDLCQMVVCSTNDLKEPSENKEKEHNKRSSNSSSPVSLEEATKEKDESHQWPHGLCPPLKNVRTRRFRKIKKKTFMDAPDVERELKRLLRADLEAQSVRWEVVDFDKPDEPLPSDKSTDSNTQNQNNEEFDGQTGFNSLFADDLSLSESDDELSRQ